MVAYIVFTWLKSQQVIFIYQLLQKTHFSPEQTHTLKKKKKANKGDKERKQKNK